MASSYDYAKNREYQLKYHKARYERLRAEGRCAMCQAPMNGDTHSRCKKCRDYHNQTERKSYRARKAMAANV